MDEEIYKDGRTRYEWNVYNAKCYHKRRARRLREAEALREGRIIKVCLRCDRELPVEVFCPTKHHKDKRSQVCDDCGKAKRRKGARKAQTEYQYRKEHGYTRAERDAYLAQHKNCMICGDTKNLMVDHCHQLKVYRGVLCNLCNSALGKFADNPTYLEAAAKYLRDRGYE